MKFVLFTMLLLVIIFVEAIVIFDMYVSRQTVLDNLEEQIDKMAEMVVIPQCATNTVEVIKEAETICEECEPCYCPSCQNCEDYCYPYKVEANNQLRRVDDCKTNEANLLIKLNNCLNQ